MVQHPAPRQLTNGAGPGNGTQRVSGWLCHRLSQGCSGREGGGGGVGTRPRYRGGFGKKPWSCVLVWYRGGGGDLEPKGLCQNGPNQYLLLQNFIVPTVKSASGGGGGPGGPPPSSCGRQPLYYIPGLAEEVPVRTLARNQRTPTPFAGCQHCCFTAPPAGVRWTVLFKSERRAVRTSGWSLDKPADRVRRLASGRALRQAVGGGGGGVRLQAAQNTRLLALVNARHDFCATAQLSSAGPFGGHSVAGREENCSAGGGGGDTEAHFPNPPPSLFGRRDGRGGFRAGVPDLPCRGGGGGGSTQHLWLKMIPTSR